MDMQCAEKMVAAVQRERKRMVYLAVESGAGRSTLARNMGLTRQRVGQLYSQGKAVDEEVRFDEAQDPR